MLLFRVEAQVLLEAEGPAPSGEVHQPKVPA